jgi:CRAL/TRIO domain
VVDFPDVFLLLRFLKVFDFDLEKAGSLLKLNLKIRWKNPKLFENRDYFNDDFQRAVKTCQIFPLPQLTKDNNKVLICRIVDSNPENYSVLEVARAVLAMMDVRYIDHDDLSDGDITIVDMHGFGFKHFLKNTTNFSTLKPMMKYTQDAVPVKVIQSHNINCSSAVMKFFNFVKPFMSKEFQNTVRFHENLESLHACVPKEILPKEYGGLAGNAEDLFQDMMEVMIRKK